MVMQQNHPSPPWLEPWLEVEFYGKSRCAKHVHKYKTVFCAQCMGEPSCELCWKNSESNNHSGHLSFVVRRASGRASVEINEIEKYWDISHIQKYKINHKDILFLNPNLGGGAAKDHDHKCETCQRKLLESEYNFCSIACKKKSIECCMQIQKSVDISLFVTIERKSATTSCSGSLRKRSRKGFPRRAPLK